MKKTLFAFFLCFAAWAAKAQLTVDNPELLTAMAGKTTYVIVESKEKLDENPYVQAVKKCWTYSPVVFVDGTEALEYYYAGHTFLSLAGVNASYGTTGVYYTTVYKVALWTLDEKQYKKKKFGMELLASFYLLAGYNSMNLMEPGVHQMVPIPTETAKSNPYIFPGLLKNVLQVMQQAIQKGKKMKYDEKVAPAAEAKNLKTDTLYIPSYLLKKLDPIGEKRNESYKAEDVLKAYKYPCRIIDAKELSALVLSSKRINYLSCFNYSTYYTCLNVFNSETGEILIKEKIDYSIDPDDMKKLASTISGI